MSLIKPLSDLRNTNEISKLALEIEVFGKLAVAQAQRADGDRGRTVSEAMKRLRKRIRSDMRDEPVRLEEVEMTDLARDPIVNGIYNGIRRGVEVAVANECYGSAVVLIYSGIDSMAYLAMPVNRIDVRRKDFIDWAERYIRFPCKEQLTGADLYGARCAMLHTYSVYSKMSREGKCRIIGYMGKAIPEVMCNPADKELVLVSVPALADAFFRGLDTFLIHAFSDKSRAPIVEARVNNLVLNLPVPEDIANI